jgi:hypothetical protein
VAERPRITIRVPDGLLEEIQQDMARDQVHGPDPAHDLTTWIVRAIRERLAHRARARAQRRPSAAECRGQLLETRWTLADPCTLEE